jgi:glyoxylase-like metal-dependent hydrolase (beta-lactamase superfamily II)
MKLILTTLLAMSLVLGASPGRAAGSLDMAWDAGLKDGKPRPHAPIEVHAYDTRTFILRENLCDTWEAPFLYLLVGSKGALLIDTGDLADPAVMPVAKTVLGLLPPNTALTVTHSHGHLDHRSGDGQFLNLPGVTVVPADLDKVCSHFGFGNWPAGRAEVDLGDRIIDVLPVPGHHRAHLAFYDRNTGLLFSGDFLLPGRLLVDDFRAYEASALRLVSFLRDKPVAAVLGGHIEKNRAGAMLPWHSHYHPEEAQLALPREDVLALPAALGHYNGFYMETGRFVIENPIRILGAFAVGFLALLAGIGVLAFRLFRKLKARKSRAPSPYRRAGL